VTLRDGVQLNHGRFTQRAEGRRTGFVGDAVVPEAFAAARHGLRPARGFACSRGTVSAATRDGGASAGAGPGLPLVLVADVDLPGKATRFDYQDVDAAHGHLIIAHMKDDAVVVVDLASGATVKVLPNIPIARGVIVGADVGRIFVTSKPAQLVI